MNQTQYAHYMVWALLVCSADHNPYMQTYYRDLQTLYDCNCDTTLCAQVFATNVWPNTSDTSALNCTFAKSHLDDDHLAVVEGYLTWLAANATERTAGTGMSAGLAAAISSSLQAVASFAMTTANEVCMCPPPPPVQGTACGGGGRRRCVGGCSAGTGGVATALAPPTPPSPPKPLGPGAPVPTSFCGERGPTSGPLQSAGTIDLGPSRVLKEAACEARAGEGRAWDVRCGGEQWDSALSPTQLHYLTSLHLTIRGPTPRGRGRGREGGGGREGVTLL